ncbi:MDR family MFS transporter [Oerskovia sp. KBS0722]|uniref:MDR family MFS transporter n=1 Tax=Oerskovia sp. KBS0722 TaxID=1179673 RepID=UPI00110E7B45|nr:MDR family MFS transporter [Oerskovia sp. KBS0722]QDW61718.1 multidrug efflux MFS transporter [Oerskovia sp. KBS0722]
MSQTQAAPAATTTSPQSLRVIWLMLGAAFVVILNETIMGVAIPNLVDDLGITIAAAQWLTTAFMLTMAVVIPITGFLIKRFTTRQIYTGAMTLFSIGTLVSATAPGFEVLLVGRIVQAGGTAMMMPLLMTTIMILVPFEARGRFMGRISIVMSVAPALGPTVSGLILSLASWRFLFWLVLPIAIVMLVIGNRRIENVGEPTRVRIDVLSVVLSALGFGGLIFGLSLIGGEAAGSGSGVQMWIALSAGALGIAAFVWRQFVLQRSDRPLLDLRIFRSRSFTIAISLMTLMMAAMFGTLILLPIYLQNVLELTPVVTGMLMLPGGLVMGLVAPTIGRLFDRYGPRPLVLPGSIIVSTALWALATLSAETQPWVIVAAHVTLSLGLALMFTPLFTSALGSLRPELYSYGSAAVGAVQQVAGAAGTALFITILSTQSVELAASGADTVTAQAGGIQLAFLIGAVLSLPVIGGAFLVRRPVAVAD